MSGATKTSSEIVFECTECGTSLSAGEGDEGAVFDCPECDTEQTVPSLDTGAPSVAASTKVAKAVPGGRRKRAPKRKISGPAGPNQGARAAESHDDRFGPQGRQRARGALGIVLAGQRPRLLQIRLDQPDPGQTAGLLGPVDAPHRARREPPREALEVERNAPSARRHRVQGEPQADPAIPCRHRVVSARGLAARGGPTVHPL